VARVLSSLPRLRRPTQCRSQSQSQVLLRVIYMIIIGRRGTLYQASRYLVCLSLSRAAVNQLTIVCTERGAEGRVPNTYTETSRRIVLACCISHSRVLKGTYRNVRASVAGRRLS
jgi:hypothetical protein